MLGRDDVAHIEARWADGRSQVGTGFLLVAGETVRLLTALHVIADATEAVIDWASSFTATFDVHGEKPWSHTFTELHSSGAGYSSTDDWFALPLPLELPTWVRKLALPPVRTRRKDCGKPVFTYGFAVHVDQTGMQGKLTTLNLRLQIRAEGSTITRTCLQTHFDQLAAGLELPGISGAPVVMDGYVIGLVSQFFTDQARRARGYVEVSGEDEKDVPAHSRLVTESDQVYLVMRTTKLSGSTTLIEVIAAQPGAAGNLPAGTYLHFTNSLPGVHAVANVAHPGLDGGSDQIPIARTSTNSAIGGTALLSPITAVLTALGVDIPSRAPHPSSKPKSKPPPPQTTIVTSAPKLAPSSRSRVAKWIVGILVVTGVLVTWLAVELIEFIESFDNAHLIAIAEECRYSAIAAAETALMADVADASWDDCESQTQLLYRTGSRSWNSFQSLAYDDEKPPRTGICRYSTSELRWMCDEPSSQLSQVEYSLVTGEPGCGSLPIPAKIIYDNFDEDPEFEFGYRVTQYDQNESPARTYWGIWFYDDQSASANYVICTENSVDDKGHRTNQCASNLDSRSPVYTNTINAMSGTQRRHGVIAETGAGVYQHDAWADLQDSRLSTVGHLEPLPVSIDALLSGSYKPMFAAAQIEHDGHWLAILKSNEPGDVKLLVRVPISPSQCITADDSAPTGVDPGNQSKINDQDDNCTTSEAAEILYVWTSGDRDSWTAEMHAWEDRVWFIETPNTVAALSLSELRLERYRMPYIVDILGLEGGVVTACASEEKTCLAVLEQTPVPVNASLPSAVREPQRSVWLDDGVIAWQSEWNSSHSSFLNIGTVRVHPSAVPSWPLAIAGVEGGVTYLKTTTHAALALHSLCGIAKCTARSLTFKLDPKPDGSTQYEIWATGIGGQMWYFVFLHRHAELQLVEASWADAPDPHVYSTLHDGDVFYRSEGEELEMRMAEAAWHPVDPDEINVAALEALLDSASDVDSDPAFLSELFSCNSDSEIFHNIVATNVLGPLVDDLDIMEYAHDLSGAAHDFHFHVGLPYSETVRVRPAEPGDECSAHVECANPEIYMICRGTCTEPECPC